MSLGLHLKYKIAYEYTYGYTWKNWPLAVPSCPFSPFIKLYWLIVLKMMEWVMCAKWSSWVYNLSYGTILFNFGLHCWPLTWISQANLTKWTLRNWMGLVTVTVFGWERPPRNTRTMMLRQARTNQLWMSLALKTLWGCHKLAVIWWQIK